MKRGGRSEGKKWREDFQREGGREVEARTELLALSTPPTGPYFSHHMVHSAKKVSECEPFHSIKTKPVSSL